MGGNGVREIVVPWSESRSFADAVGSQGKGPLGPFWAIPALLLVAYLFLPVAMGLKVVAGLVLVAWGGMAFWRARMVMATPEYRERAAVVRLLADSPEYVGAYACLQGACDELKWFVEEKSVDKEGKPLVRRVYPTVSFVVELDRALAATGVLGDEVRLRFDTTKAAMDSPKLGKGAPVLASKLGLNGYEAKVDLTRGQTRHADVCFSRHPGGDLYQRYGRKQ